MTWCSAPRCPGGTRTCPASRTWWGCSSTRSPCGPDGPRPPRRASCSPRCGSTRARCWRTSTSRWPGSAARPGRGPLFDTLGGVRRGDRRGRSAASPATSCVITGIVQRGRPALPVDAGGGAGARRPPALQPDLRRRAAAGGERPGDPAYVRPDSRPVCSPGRTRWSATWRPTPGRRPAPITPTTLGGLFDAAAQRDPAATAVTRCGLDGGTRSLTLRASWRRRRTSWPRRCARPGSGRASGSPSPSRAPSSRSSPWSRSSPPAARTCRWTWRTRTNGWSTSSPTPPRRSCSWTRNSGTASPSCRPGRA